MPLSTTQKGFVYGILTVLIVGVVSMTIFMLYFSCVVPVFTQACKSRDFLDFADRLAKSGAFNFDIVITPQAEASIRERTQPPLIITHHLYTFFKISGLAVPPTVALLLKRKFGLESKVLCYSSYNKKPIVGKIITRLTKDQILVDEDEKDKFTRVIKQIDAARRNGVASILMADAHSRHLGLKRIRQFYVRIMDHYATVPKYYVTLSEDGRTNRFPGTLHGPMYDSADISAHYKRTIKA